MELETTASTIEVSENGIVIRWSDGARSRFHSLWLRDNCPSGRDKVAGFRTFSLVDLNPDIWVMDAFRNDDGDLELEFSDGHESIFSFEWLQAHSHEPHDRRGRARTISHFRAGHEFERFAFPIAGSSQHCDLLESISRWGAAIVTGVDGDLSGTEAVAALVGRIRDTDVGRLIDVVTEPDVWTLGSSDLAPDPHTDDPYRYMPSGTSILHCVQAPMSSGDSILVDGFGIAADLFEDDPDVFDLLAETSVPFVRHRTESVDQGEDVHLLAHGPIISVDRDHEISGIRFDERSMAPLDLDPAVVGDFYRALITFTTEVNNPGRAVQFHLEPGEAIIYDNQRVLHGYTDFGLNDAERVEGLAASGQRLLRRCTVERDQFHARLRRLREVHERLAVDERLPSGSRV